MNLETRRKARISGPPALVVALLLLVTAVLCVPTGTNAAIAENAGGGVGTGGGGETGEGTGGGNGSSGSGGGSGSEEEEESGGALERVIERVVSTLSRAAEARDRTVAAVRRAVQGLGSAEVLGFRSQLEGAATVAAYTEGLLPELDAQYQRAEGIDPDNLEAALRAGVLMSEVKLIGDPVHPSTGALHHQEREFFFPIGETVFDMSRLHRSDQSLGRYFGSAWFAPFESFSFFSLPERLPEMNLPELQRLAERLNDLSAALTALGESRFGGVGSRALEEHFRRKQAEIEEAQQARTEAAGLLQEAQAIAPGFFGILGGEALAEEVEELGEEMRELLALLAVDRVSGEELRTLLPELRRLSTEVSRAAETARGYQRFLAVVDQRSEAALGRGVPNRWRKIGAGVVGVVDEKGTLLLYRFPLLSSEGSVRLGVGRGTALGKQADTLELLADGQLLRRNRLGWRFLYDGSGRLVEQRDRNGHGYQLSHQADAILIRGSYGRAVRLELSGRERGPRVRAAYAPDGTVWRYNYDSAGELSAARKPDGGLYRYEYEDAHGSGPAVRRIEKPDGSLLRFDYGDGRRIVEVSDEEGRRQTFSYLAERRTLTMVDRRGGATTFHFDERGLPVRRKDPSGTVWDFRYDRDGRLVTRRGPGGEEERWAYTGSGPLREHRVPSGATLRYRYDGEERIAALEGGPRGGASYEYDHLGNLSEIRGPWGRWTFSRDRKGRPISMRDALGNRWRFSYGTRGMVTEVVQPDGTVRGFRYDLFGRLLTLTDEAGETVHFSYDAKGELTEVIDRTGAVERFQHNLRGDLIRRVHPNGDETTHRYDRTHREVSTTLPDGRRIDREYDGEGALLQISLQGRPIATFLRDRAGRVVSRENPLLSAVERSTLDELGRVVERRGPEDGVTTFAYYPGGALREIRNPVGAITALRRDTWGRLTVLIDPLGCRRRTDYDDAGRVIRTVTPLGRECRFCYDAMGRLSSWTDEEGGVHQYERNWRGSPVAYRTPEGRLWRYEYDERGLLTAEVSPEGRENRYEHDSEGRIVSVSGGVGLPWRLSYDWAGRVTQASLGDAIWLFEYDRAGRLIRRTDPDGVYQAYAYDELDRLRGLSGPGLGVRRTEITGLVERIEGTRSYTLTRDRRGLVVGYADPDGVCFTYAYDQTGRLSRAQRPEGVCVSLERDLLGRPVRIVHDDGSQERRSYDQDGRVTAIDHSSGPPKAFRYDHSGRVVGIRVGTAEWVSRTYDRDGNLLTEGASSEEGRSHRRFSYDQDGLLIGASSESGRVEYECDAGGRVIRTTYSEEGVVIERQYGDAGVLSRLELPLLDLSVEREWSAGGRLRSVGLNGRPMIGFEYDEAGREVARTAAGIGTIRRSYDNLGRPRAAVFQASGRLAVQAVVYEYTEAGRLAGELLSDGTGKLYRYDRAGLPRETTHILPAEERPKMQSATTNHASYRSLERKLEDIVPHVPTGTIRHRAWLETLSGGGQYRYPENGEHLGGDRLRYDALGQLSAIEIGKGAVQFIEGPLGRLTSFVLSEEESTEEAAPPTARRLLTQQKTLFYSAPDDLYPLLTRNNDEVSTVAIGSSPHRHSPATGSKVEGFSASLSDSDRRTRALSAESSTEWNLLLMGPAYPSLYVRLCPDGSLGGNAAETEERSLIGRDLRGTPLWRFNEHSGITQKWLYTAQGSCIIGSVDNEAALGFAAGTQTGSLLRLGYRFYDPATGHFTMADPSGRDLHPTRYAGGDPINSVDPWGLEQYNMMGFDRQNERLLVQVWDDRRPNRPIRVMNYGATNRVRSPEERAFTPVRYDPNSNAEGDEYHYFPEEFPDSPEEGWRVHSPYQSENSNVGPAIRTDAYRFVDTYSSTGEYTDSWNVDGTAQDTGYYLHGGVGTTTWGCIRLSDADVSEIQEAVQSAEFSHGNSRLYTIEGSSPE